MHLSLLTPMGGGGGGDLPLEWETQVVNKSMSVCYLTDVCDIIATD